jgi:hypothetical protein
MIPAYQIIVPAHLDTVPDYLDMFSTYLKIVILTSYGLAFLDMVSAQFLDMAT